VVTEPPRLDVGARAAACQGTGDRRVAVPAFCDSGPLARARLDLGPESQLAHPGDAGLGKTASLARGARVAAVGSRVYTRRLKA
jgi:hypothetical protein